ncbi:MAG: AAA family ATPase [Pseudomonadota bacterium]
MVGHTAIEKGWARPPGMVGDVQPLAADSMQEAWGAVLRRRAIVLSVFVLVAGIGVVAALTRPVLYESAAVLMINPREPENVLTQTDQPQRAPDSGYVDSQVEILRSPGLAAQLVDELHLVQDPEWTRGGARTGRADVIAQVQKAIVLRRRASSYVVEVAVRSKNASKAALMSNTLAQLYVTSRAQARIVDAQRTRDWLGRRLTELSGELQQREAEIETFRAQSGLLTAGGVPLTEQQIQEAETSVLAANVDLADHEARWRQAQHLATMGGAGESLPTVLTSDVMVALRAREADVNRRLAEYSDRYGLLHPSVIAAQAEKEDIERQIAAEVNRLTESLRNEADVSRARESTLQSHLASVRTELVRNNGQMVHLNELERGAAATRAVYAGFYQRYNELADGAAGLGGDAEYVAMGAPPAKPVSRSLPLMLAISISAGLLAGIFAALVLEKLNTRVKTPEDIERRFGLSILATIPRLGGRELDPLGDSERHPGGFAVSQPRSAFTESIRLLRARVSRACLSTSTQTVAIASALPREGKTTIALCLARVAAMSGRRVVLVDCDMRGGSLNVLLGIQPRRGILQILRGEVGWQEVVGSDETSGAHIIPSPGDSFTPEDVFGTDAMQRLLRELTENYELVVLDCPPILTLAESRDIAMHADGVVVVARSGQTSTYALRTAVSELSVVGANIIGVALNGVNPKAAGHSSYGDPLYFSHAQRGVYTT